ncbi:hypothetical protein AT248_07485 [Bartonella henselae]|nr:hypothetical protein BhenCHDE101_03425 [Bartonella henselae]OLL40046.1 hypothetical protein AT237_07275 [Bartonella henselae]OLL48328.1 hypothetical protein AT242_03705 [Bartonella henselae]OLL58698.1 hypothetical protein AT248_07485 [Bartonella henselae]PNM38370.1 hypothetical protein AL470_002695 [Bartonella henselae str. Houston-1]
MLSKNDIINTKIYTVSYIFLVLYQYFIITKIFTKSIQHKKIRGFEFTLHIFGKAVTIGIKDDA